MPQFVETRCLCLPGCKPGSQITRVYMSAHVVALPEFGILLQGERAFVFQKDWNSQSAEASE
jgi:hypothetical protein